MEEQKGFQKLLLSMMTRRWLMTLVVLITFMAIAVGILISIHIGSEVSGEWWSEVLTIHHSQITNHTYISVQDELPSSHWAAKISRSLKSTVPEWSTSVPWQL